MVTVRYESTGDRDRNLPIDASNSTTSAAAQFRLRDTIECCRRSNLVAESALARLMRGLRREPHDYRSSLQVFVDLQPERVSSELGLEKLGAERGARNEPASRSTAFDEVEHAIIERIEAEKKSAYGTLLDEQNVYAERLSNLDIEGRLSLIQQAAPEAIGNLRA